MDGKSVTVVDLPGIYPRPPTPWRRLARDFIVGEHPDAIIDIVDATNIERNLYLTAQLLELERPMVIALNFMDEARKHGDKLDCGRLQSPWAYPWCPLRPAPGRIFRSRCARP